MPLLHKKPFAPNEFPPDLKDSEEVFFCKLTREIFRDYDEFCERIILCNSLVWSCSLTGRSHLTYQEAVASEQKVKTLLKRFPMELRIPVLYLASLCERRSLLDLAEDVYIFVKDRFFIGETVQVSLDDGSVESCHVLAVIPPTPEELVGYKAHNVKNGERQYWPPASLYKYEVERMDTCEELTVSASQIYRKKSDYNKDKNRLYIKQFVHLDSGFWRLKEASNTKYGISKIKFEQIFCGDPPVMTPKKATPVKRKLSDKGKRQETLNKYFKQQDPKLSMASQRRSPKKADLGRKMNGKIEKQRRRRRTKKEMELANRFRSTGNKEVDIEAKRKANAEKKQEKMKLAEFVKEWQRKREDLECEDLKELPVPHMIECKAPNEYYGDMIMIMEFLNSFRKVIPKDYYLNGFTFDLIERAFVEQEVEGPFYDILLLLMMTIFELQENEAEEMRDIDVKINPGLKLERGDKITMETMRQARSAEKKVRQWHAQPLSQLMIDSSTITEVIRLHLLTSGARPSKDKPAKWRYQARGGYCSNDDPAVILKIKEPHIIQHLNLYSVWDLKTRDRVSLLNCLVNQIITYSTARDLIDEGCDRKRQCRVEIRSLNAAEVRREKEEALRQKEMRQKGEEQVQGEGQDETGLELRSKGESKRGEQERLTREMREAMAGAQLLPLGMDRAYRRYWVFASIPGLFVEHKEENPGPCLPKGTPYFTGIGEEDNYSYVRRLFEEGCNKENYASEKHTTLHMSSPGKRFLAEKNGSDSPVIQRARTKSDSMNLQPLTCWGDTSICPVHSEAAQQVTWAFFKDEAEINQLIDSLNRRGVRESKLRNILLQERDNLFKRLPSCPVEKLNPSLVEKPVELRPKGTKKGSKAYENAYWKFPPGTPIDTILESNLRDLILETEEKVSGGALGFLKVDDRKAWRKAISNQSYDKQCKKLVWGGKFDASEDGSDDESVKKEELEDDEKKLDDDDKNDSESRSSTPSLDLTLHPLNSEAETVFQRPVILDLASAILQIGQCIEYKYMKRPLGLDQKDRERLDLKMPTPAMERWEAALMKSTSFSQLYLHLSTLDNSVIWARSALHAYCKICLRRTDPEHMLLCDTCNKGHHMYCLKPKLTKIPPGDWHCPKCTPREKISPVKKRRHMFSEDSDDDEDLNNYGSARKLRSKKVFSEKMYDFRRSTRHSRKRSIFKTYSPFK